MKLNEIKIGETFKIAGIEFIKFTDGEEVIAVAKNILFNSSFGNNANLAENQIKTLLETEILPKLEAEIGAENILEFETDMTTLDGAKPFENFRSKVSLVTLDFYQQHSEIFKAYPLKCWWWLATICGEIYDDTMLCISPFGRIRQICHAYLYGVRPILHFAPSTPV